MLLCRYVLFQNDSLASLLARLVGILGPIPKHMLRTGRYAHRFFTKSGHPYERSSATGQYQILQPKVRRAGPKPVHGCMAILRPRLTFRGAMALP